MRNSLELKFAEYHAANPHVYELVIKFALEAHDAGRDHYGIAAIFERVRWHLNIETRGDEFKMNNNYRAYYARKLMNEYPIFNGMFRTRELRAT